MEDRKKLYIVSGFAVLFLVLWLTTWILFAYNAVHHPVQAVFKVNEKRFLEDMNFLAQYVSCKIHDQGIPISIACGTALAAARQGTALSHDDDVDFFIKKQDSAKVEKILRQDPLIVDVRKVSFGLQFSVKGKQSYCDIFFLAKQPDSSDWKYSGHHDREVDYFTDEDWKDLAKLPYGRDGEAVQLRHPNAYLTRFFGPRWKTFVVVKPMHSDKRQPLYKGMDIASVLKGKLLTS